MTVRKKDTILREEKKGISTQKHTGENVSTGYSLLRIIERQKSFPMARNLVRCLLYHTSPSVLLNCNAHSL